MKIKKIIIGLLVLGMVGVIPAWCQHDKFSLNFGLQTNIWDWSSFDKAAFTLDARLGSKLTKSLRVSFELMGMYNYGSFISSDMDVWLIYPGVMLNQDFGRFFVGLGLAWPFAIGEGEVDVRTPAPKINVGYIFGRWQVTAYLITWTDKGLDFLDWNWAGISLGYRF